MSNQESIQALFQTGEEKSITLAFTIIEGGAVTPLEVMPNLHEQYDFLLKHGQVSEVESDIEKLAMLVRLEIVSLSGRNLTTIPSFDLPNLKKLSLFNNKLTEIPELNCPNLEWLRLNNNELTTMPFFNQPNLRWLSLSYNKLTTIPSFDLPNLEYLFVRQNKLLEPYSHPTVRVFNSY